MENQAFASMRIHMWEKEFIKPGQWERMIDAENYEAALEILKETRFGALFPGDDANYTLSEVLKRELQKQADAVLDLVKEPALKRLLFLRYDYHNLKILVKASTEPDRFSALFFPFGSLFLPNVKKQILAKKTFGKASRAEEAAVHAAKIWDETEDAQKVDSILDRAYFEDMHELSAKTGSIFFKAYAREITDFTNLLSFFRARWQNQPRHFLTEVFLPGGSISLSDLLSSRLAGPAQDDGKDSLSGVSMENLLAMLHRGGASTVTTQAWAQFGHDGDINALEKARDRVALQLAEAGGRRESGEALLFAYIVKVRTEIQDLNIIFGGKRIGLSPEEITSHVRCAASAMQIERSSHA